MTGQRRMAAWAVLVLGVELTLVLVAAARAAEPSVAQRKAELQRKMAESQRKLDQAKREMKAVQNRQQKNGLDMTKVRGGGPANFRGGDSPSAPGDASSFRGGPASVRGGDLANARRGALSRPEAPPFNAANAPPPDECLKRFVAAARSATSIEQIMPFLPQNEQTAMRALQSGYDPKTAASSRQWHRQQNPDISDESLDHITGPPNASALKFHKGLANEILDILSVKVDGDTANLVVSTTSGATINGGHYPYGKADVEMVGEGNMWKLSRYRPSILYYQEPPKTP